MLREQDKSHLPSTTRELGLSFRSLSFKDKKCLLRMFK